MRDHVIQLEMIMYFWVNTPDTATQPQVIMFLSAIRQEDVIVVRELHKILLWVGYLGVQIAQVMITHSLDI